MAVALPENPRKTWSTGHFVEIYRTKQKKWYKGKIAGIDNDDDGEWLKVTYKTDKNEIMMRKVQRYSDQVQPIGGDNQYKSINNDNNDNINDDDNKEEKNNIKRNKFKLNLAKEEVIYPADKYLDEVEREEMALKEKGTAKNTIKLLKELKCVLWDISDFNPDDDMQREVAYVCDDGWMIHAEVVRINGSKDKAFIHLGNDYRHYDFNLKQKSIWVSYPNERLFGISALQKYKNPNATSNVNANNANNGNDSDEEPPNAFEFFRKSTGMSAGELQRHKSVENIVNKFVTQ